MKGVFLPKNKNEIGLNKIEFENKKNGYSKVAILRLPLSLSLSLSLVCAHKKAI